MKSYILKIKILLNYYDNTSIKKIFERNLMAGQIKKMLDHIIKEVSHENKVIISSTRTKIILKGVNPHKYNDLSPDDPITIEKVKLIASDFGVKILY